MVSSPSASLRLTPAMRVKQRAAFVRIRAKGKRLVLGSLIANWLSLPPGSLSQIGIITSRKVGAAVCRNRVRRLIREAFRIHQHELASPVQLVLVARPSIARKNYAEVERDYLGLLKQAKLLRG